MRLIALAVILLALCGCVRDIVNEPVEVHIPIPVPCKPNIIDVPVWPTAAITAQSTRFDKIKALAATNEERKAYETTLVAANAACQ